MKKLAKILAVALIALTLALSVGCNESDHSHWDVKRYETGSGDVLTFSVVLKMNKTNNKNVKEVWVNIDSLAKDEVELTHVFGYSATSLASNRATSKISKAKATDADGWVRIVLTGENGYGHDYFRLSVTETMHINEIVLVDIEDKVIPTTIASYSEKATENAGNEWTLDEYKAMVEEDGLENTVLNVIDEQSKFVLETVRSLFDAANPAK